MLSPRLLPHLDEQCWPRTGLPNPPLVPARPWLHTLVGAPPPPARRSAARIPPRPAAVCAPVHWRRVRLRGRRPAAQTARPTRCDWPRAPAARPTPWLRPWHPCVGPAAKPAAPRQQLLVPVQRSHAGRRLPVGPGPAARCRPSARAQLQEQRHSSGLARPPPRPVMPAPLGGVLPERTTQTQPLASCGWRQPPTWLQAELGEPDDLTYSAVQARRRASQVLSTLPRAAVQVPATAFAARHPPWSEHPPNRPPRHRSVSQACGHGRRASFARPPRGHHACAAPVPAPRFAARQHYAAAPPAAASLWLAPPGQLVLACVARPGHAQTGVHTRSNDGVKGRQLSRRRRKHTHAHAYLDFEGLVDFRAPRC